MQPLRTDLLAISTVRHSLHDLVPAGQDEPFRELGRQRKHCKQ